MQQIKKSLQLTKEQYYETHLSIINPILPNNLTPMEIKVLAAFMSLDGSISESEYRFGTTARKMVKARLEISDAGVSNYMTQLIEKGFLIEKEVEGEKKKKIDILSILLPEKNEQIYMFKLVNLN